MCDGHKSCDERLKAAKLEALAEFAAGAGHEINNPLAVIINQAQRLLADEVEPQRRQALTAIGAQAYRIRDMIVDAMLFGRPPLPIPEQRPLAADVRETLDKLPPFREPVTVQLKRELDDAVLAWADPVQLKIVISSLLQNAVEAVSNSGCIDVQVTSVLVNERRFARLCVTDDGPGMNEKDREHLFDPFYSGRQAGRGLGFGLSKCWRIVVGHGGEIDVQTTEPGRTSFTVLLPSSPELPSHPESPSHPEDVVGKLE